MPASTWTEATSTPLWRRVKHATGGQQQPWISSSPIEGDYFLGEQEGGAPSLWPRCSNAVMTPASAALQTKVRAATAMRDIPVPPAIPIAQSQPDVPATVAQFVGVWGPGRWVGRRGANDFILAVTDVNRAGEAHVMVMTSAGCVDEACSVRAPFIGHIAATILDGYLQFRSSRTIMNSRFR
jgi:hypothetical protein